MRKFKAHRVSSMLLTLALALCVMLPLLGSTAYAAESPNGQTIRIGRIDYEGFFDQNEDGTYSGYGVDYLTEISKYTGWNYEYVTDDWESLLQQLKDGEIDFICHAQKTEEREENYLFAKYSNGTESSVLYVRNDDERYYYNDYESFQGMKIAVLKDSFQNPEFEEYAEKKGISFEFVEYSTSDGCFTALEEGKVDAVAMGSLALRSDFKIVCRFGADPFYFMTGKMNQELMDELDEALGLISINKPYFQVDIYKKHYGGIENYTTLFTREEAQYIKDHPQITVGLISSQSPLSYVDENGNTSGITMGLVNLISEKCGIQFQYDFLDIGQSGYDYLTNSDAKMVAGIMSTEFFPLNPNLLVSDTLLDTSFVIVARSGEKFDPNMEAVMALPKNYIADEKALNKKFPNFTFVKCEDITECLTAILSGKADFMMQNRYVVQEVLRNPRYASLEIIDAYQVNEDMKIVMLHGDELLEDIINKSIGSISSDERDSIIVNNTVARVYHQSLEDTLYTYRLPLLVIAFLFVLLLGMFVFLMVYKQRNLKRMKLKNEQLSEAVERADSANMATKQFLARMSHDMRTPMNGILGLSYIMEAQVGDPVILQELHQLRDSGNYLLQLINDVLDINKITSGNLSLQPKVCDEEQVFNSIISLVEPQMKQKNITFSFEKINIDWKWMMLDAQRVKQIFINLLTNATKFTPEGGKIDFVMELISETDNMIRNKFMIRDTGIGMSDDFVPHAFDPFAQENKIHENLGGTGLGLAIVKNLVEQMGGNITVESEEGRGTTFTLYLNFALAEKPKEPAKETVSPQANCEEPLKGIQILLCEDHPLNAEIATRLLEKKGAIVTRAENGKVGFELFAQSAAGYFKVILMDIRMPVMDGLQTTKAIRECGHPDAKSVPIIAMSANAYDEDIQKSLQAGMNAYLAKPIEPKELYKTIAKELL